MASEFLFGRNGLSSVPNHEGIRRPMKLKKKTVSIKIEKSLWAEVKKFCINVGCTASDFVELVIVEAMKEDVKRTTSKGDEV